jgi:hypothetical protein
VNIKRNILAIGSVAALMLGGSAALAVTSSVPADASYGARVTPTSGSFAININGTDIYGNAWNNGPYWNTYTQLSDNDAITTVTESGGLIALEYTNTGGSYYGGLLGDYGNSSTDARAAINTPNGGTVPWGGLFEEVACPGGQIALKNIHWSGSGSTWLAPALPTESGGAWYLNSTTEICYTAVSF